MRQPLKTEEIVLNISEELKEAVTKLPEMIKASINRNPNVFLNLLNEFLMKAQYPSYWKIAKIILIEKEKASSDNEKKYRPICLLCSVSKIFDKKINKRD